MTLGGILVLFRDKSPLLSCLIHPNYVFCQWCSASDVSTFRYVSTVQPQRRRRLISSCLLLNIWKRNNVLSKNPRLRYSFISFYQGSSKPLHIKIQNYITNTEKLVSFLHWLKWFFSQLRWNRFAYWTALLHNFLLNRIHMYNSEDLDVRNINPAFVSHTIDPLSIVLKLEKYLPNCANSRRAVVHVSGKKDTRHFPCCVTFVHKLLKLENDYTVDFITQRSIPQITGAIFGASEMPPRRKDNEYLTCV